MNDVVVLQLINSGFWLIIVSGISLVFRNEIKKLLLSMGSFKVAGSSFDFNNRKETIESYVILAETLIDLLSRSNLTEQLATMLDSTTTERLSSFALRYTEETPRENWNEELVKNIAHLLFRQGRFIESIKFYDILLKSRPEHLDLLNLKGLAMITSRLPDLVDKALPIFKNLVERYPEKPHVRFNYALAHSLAGDHKQSIAQMEIVIDRPNLELSPDPLNDLLFHKTKMACPEEYARLEDIITQWKSRT